MSNTATLIANSDTASTPENTSLNFNVVANDTNQVGGALTLTGVTQGTHGTVAITAAPNYAVKISNGQNINAGSVLAYDKNQPWTMMTSLNVAQNPTEAAVIFTNANAAPYPCYEAWIDPTGHLRVRIISNFPANYIDVQSSVVVTDGKWHNVAISYDGSSSASGVKIYLDGVQDTATTIVANSLTGSIVGPTHGPLIIGNQTNWPFALNGSLDYFSISNQVRSPSYIAQFSSPGSTPPVDANTVLYYNFNEDTGTVAHDLSSDGYAATLSSSSMWTLGPVVPATVTYTPDPGFVGTDTFSYTETNGTETATGQVTVTVNGVAITIQTDGSTSLVEVGSNYFLDTVGSTSGPELKYQGANVTVGEFTGWVPIGAVQTASGYDVAWKETGTNQYTVWTTDKNGNFINSIGVVSGTSSALESYEPVFGQDLNGDGTIVIQTDGTTRLVEIGSNYFLDAVGSTSGPELKYQGANVTVGEFTGWVPIGAVQTASGYDVAWKETVTNQYTVWTTDKNGNFINSIGVVSGTSSALESYEPVFGQDLNGDGTIVIQTDGTTRLVEIGSNYFLDAVGSTSGPELKYQGANVTVGEFTGWVPIGAVQTASGYDVAWKETVTNQYTVWTTDKNGNFINSIGVVSGTSLSLEPYEPVFGQDLNRDGVIGLYAVPGTALQIGVTLSSPSGSATIGTGATLELEAADSASVTFQGHTGTLRLDHSSTFSSEIFNFTGNGSLSGSDQIDLKDVKYNSVKDSYANGVLTVTDGGGDVARLSFNGSYTLANFDLASDGLGGTTVYDPPVLQPCNANVALLGQYMASSLGAGDSHAGNMVFTEPPQISSPSLLTNPQHA